MSAATTAGDARQTCGDIALVRSRALFSASWTVGSVVRFHSEHKLLLMAHSPDAYRELGRLVADARHVSRNQFKTRYASRFTAALQSPATRGGHVNALQHAAGYFKRCLDRSTTAELTAAIDDYRRERAPLVVPIALLRQYAHEHGVSYLVSQAYLDLRFD